MEIFRGCGVAIVTPFREDESLDEERFRDLIEWQIAEGIDAIIACAPSYATLRALADRTGIEVVVLHSKQTYSRDRQLRTRVFAPAFGYLEDPATGSGNAALAHWLRRSGTWTGDSLAIEQGPDRVAPNLVTIRAAADGGLRIGGCGVARIEGEFLLH